MARFVFTILLCALVLSVSRCSSFYYQERPLISVQVNSLRVAMVGDYVYDYASRKDIDQADLVIIEDSHFGCPNEANYTLPPEGSWFVLMVPFLGINSPCSEYLKAVAASQVWGAAGIIFYYTPGDPQEGKLPRRRAGSPPLQKFSVTKVELTASKMATIISEVDKGATARVTVMVYSHPLQTTQTFYFIVFAFCILMLLSCLWFVMSYIKRCHYSIQRRRRRVSVLSRKSICIFLGIQLSYSPHVTVILHITSYLPQISPFL